MANENTAGDVKRDTRSNDVKLKQAQKEVSDSPSVTVDNIQTAITLLEAGGYTNPEPLTDDANYIDLKNAALAGAALMDNIRNT